jgi:hypothetical protein
MPPEKQGGASSVGDNVGGNGASSSGVRKSNGSKNAGRNQKASADSNECPEASIRAKNE